MIKKQAKRQTQTTLTDVQRSFKAERSCKTHLERQRWSDKIPLCIYCKKPAFKTASGYKCKDRKTCKGVFNIRTGTIYENSNVPLSKWFTAIYYATRKRGINSIELANEINLTQKTAYRMLEQIRKLFRQIPPKQMIDIISVDEKYFGGLEKWKNEVDRIGGTQGRSTKTKIPVVCVYHWSGYVYLRVTSNAKANTLKQLIRPIVNRGSIVITDSLKSYNWLTKAGYLHVSLNHKAGEMARGCFHNNFPENVFHHLNRFIRGTFLHVNKQNLQQYLDWFCFLFNNQKQDKYLTIINLSAQLLPTPAIILPVAKKIKKAA